MVDISHPVGITVLPQLEGRNRLTTFFRFFLGIPHILLVGGPAVAGAWIGLEMQDGVSWDRGADCSGPSSAW